MKAPEFFKILDLLTNKIYFINKNSVLWVTPWVLNTRLTEIHLSSGRVVVTTDDVLTTITNITKRYTDPDVI